jgi:hypothetical protein
LYRNVFGVMQEKVPNSLQGIPLHCFHGDSVTVKLWLNSYPGTYFGFTMKMKGFGDRQRLGLKSVPGNRFLLEFDPPRLPESLGELQLFLATSWGGRRPPTKLTCCRGEGAGHFVRNSWIPVLGSSRSLRRYLSRCIWESIAYGTRT